MKPGGEILKAPFKIEHSAKEMLSLVDLINSYDREARAVLEDTGHYHLPVVTMIVENGIFVCTINALRMKKYCSQSLHKAKTDKLDSIKIASYDLTYWHELMSFKPSENIYKELKLLARQYYQTISMLFKAKVNLSNLLDQVMPEIQSLMRDGKNSHRLTDFVDKYWHFKRILDIDGKRFTSDYCK